MTVGTCVEETASVNVADLVGLHDGTVLVSTYDWTNYLSQFFKKLPKIKSYHHFRFHKDFPGTIFCKKYWNSEEIAINILRNDARFPEGGHAASTHNHPKRDQPRTRSVPV